MKHSCVLHCKYFIICNFVSNKQHYIRVCYWKILFYANKISFFIPSSLILVAQDHMLHHIHIRLYHDSRNVIYRQVSGLWRIVYCEWLAITRTNFSSTPVSCRSCRMIALRFVFLAAEFHRNPCTWYVPWPHFCAPLRISGAAATQ